ncbi:MAG: ATPase, partial [Nonomuraea sp.]|nr:ATPase [Nonomuraea sp.]
MVRILAVDGGNSKTDVVLLSADGDVLARGRGGPFVPHRDGVAAAVDVVARVVAELGIAEPADHVVAYLAGADLP